jgi:hypothetical protein
MITEKTAEKLGTMVGYGALIGAVVFGFTACSGKKEEAKATVTPAAVVAPAVVTPKAEPVELVDGWNWSNPSDLFLKLSSVKIKNNTNQDIKDPEISCSAFGESGTRIDSNRREQFKIIKAGETIDLGSVDMGFLRSQADKVGCTISNYKKV